MDLVQVQAMGSVIDGRLELRVVLPGPKNLKLQERLDIVVLSRVQ